VQDAFVGIVRSRGGIRRRGSIEAFAWRAVVNAARDRRVVGADGAEPPDVAAPDTPEPDERIRHAIGALPERQRLVLFLRYFADLDYGAIGEVVHTRPGTVAARPHRPRKRHGFPHMPLSNPGSRYSRAPIAHHPVNTGERSMVKAAA
jgi:RNA polymerase sigma factor (sigma-70 family)